MAASWRTRGRKARRRSKESKALGTKGLTTKEQSAIRRVLHGRPNDSNGAGYNPDYHPAHIVTWFMGHHDNLEDPIAVVTRNEDLKYVQPPSKVPSFAGYAIETGIRRETLWAWADTYTEYGEAYNMCKAIQEAVLIQLGANGAHVPAFATLMMKNLQGWQEKVEQTHKGGVKLNFDKDDEEA